MTSTAEKKKKKRGATAAIASFLETHDQNFDGGFNDLDLTNPVNLPDEVTETFKVELDKIDLWKLADRPSDELGDIDFLMESIKKDGQQIPALVREKDDGRYDLIYGYRRYHCCKELNIPLYSKKADISSLKQLAKLQFLENSAREDLSNYAKFKSFKRYLDEKVFKDQREIANFFNISESNFSKIMIYNRINSEVIESLINLKSISYKTMEEIYRLSKDQKKREVIITLADKISSLEINSGNLANIVANKMKISENPENSIDSKVPQDYMNFKISEKTGRLTINLSSSLQGKLPEIKEYLMSLIKDPKEE